MARMLFTEKKLHVVSQRHIYRIAGLRDFEIKRDANGHLR